MIKIQNTYFHIFIASERFYFLCERRCNEVQFRYQTFFIKLLTLIKIEFNIFTLYKIMFFIQYKLYSVNGGIVSKSDAFIDQSLFLERPKFFRGKQGEIPPLNEESSNLELLFLVERRIMNRVHPIESTYYLFLNSTTNFSTKVLRQNYLPRFLVNSILVSSFKENTFSVLSEIAT